MDAYFKTNEGTEEYARHEPINARYNLDLLAAWGMKPSDFRDKKVLDAGCGFGLLLKSFHDAGAHCFGTDISELAIARCREKFPYLKTEVADCTRMPFREKFSLITCFGTLGLVKKDDHGTFLGVAYESLEEGGTLFATAPNADRPGFMDRLSGRKRSDSYRNARSTADWKALMESAGFKEYAVSPVLRMPKFERLAGKNVFLRLGFGDPLVIVARKQAVPG